MNKRGQFFLLAAVIISVVIISLGVGMNRASVSNEPDSFYDFSYDVQREVGALIDYEVYTGFDLSTNLTEFVDLLAEDIMERNPGSELIFIYGTNSTDMVVSNYGSDSIYADGIEVGGSDEDTSSSICIEEFCQKVNRGAIISSINRQNIDRVGNDDVLVEVGGIEYNFPISSYKQVIFIMKNDVGGDSHVAVS